jgi:putative transposase
LVDTLGLLLGVVVHGANVQDRDGAKLLFIQVATWFPTIQRVWADGGYAGKLIEWLQRWSGWTLEIVKKLADTAGFQLLPRRWIVERTLAWFGHQRRLSKDYEYLTLHSEAMVQVASIQLMLHRLCRSPCHQRRR